MATHGMDDLSARKGGGVTLEEFARVVRALRISQQIYFHTRSLKTLKECKAQEREVDALCHRILSDQPELL